MEENQKFNKEIIEGMAGTPWQPVPGKKSNRIPTKIKEEGEEGDEDDEAIEEEEEQEFEVQVEVDEDEDASKLAKPDLEGREIKHRALSVRREDIKQYGYTDGCLGCKAIKGKWSMPYSHNAQCRRRISEKLMEEMLGRERVQRAEERVKVATGGHAAKPNGQEEGRKASREMSGEMDQEDRHNGDAMQQDGDDIAFEIDPEKWKAFSARIGRKRSAEEELSGPKQNEPKIEESSGSGQKRRSADDSTEEQSSKIKRINSIMEGLNSKDKQIFMQILSIESQENHRIQYFLNSAICGPVKHPDVSEIYSPARVVQFAKEHNLKPGWSLDLTTCDIDGRPWDFSQEEMRRRAIRRVKEDKPMFVIGSPMCTNFSMLMNANWGRMHPEEAKRRWESAVAH
eukprot:10231375-Karenia_brevis.AAC.1